MAFVKATKEQTRLRLAVFGPSGSGKTYTSLRIAAGIGGPVALIDSERRSARKYSDRFDFVVNDLTTKTIDGYTAAIAEAADAGVNVLIIDSLSHAWQELLGEVDKIAKAKFRGNTWSAWSEGTPKQRKLVDALLDCPCHIIATMRSRTEWLEEKDDRGKVRPVKVGLSPEQGKGIEYEFDMLMELNTEHYATISKDRTGKYQDRMIEKPGEEFGGELAAWLGEGSPAAPPQDPGFMDRLSSAFIGRGFDPDSMDTAVADVLKSKGWRSVADVPAADQTKFLDAIAAGKFDKYRQNATVNNG